ncbi:MAG: HAMP domain-containing histidine kinase [bacterium]|nr:HAMP domain-containing histidine kinase [bacterium]
MGANLITRIFRKLHVRLTVMFILLLAVSVWAYVYWMGKTVLEAFDDETERNWYEQRAEAEIDSLAGELAGEWPNRNAADSLLCNYGRQVEEFEAEIVLFDATGRYFASCRPDSLAAAVPEVDPELLADMSDGVWDFSYYPDPRNVDLFVNRIFDVARVTTSAGDTVAEAFLVASFEPLTIRPDDASRDERSMVLGALALLLVYAATSSLIIMAWTSRRVSRLSRGVAAFTAGDLRCRVPDGSKDEIGALGRDINAMASRIETMVEELQRKEQFQRDLVANVSHDLRTPLTAVRGYVESLNLQEEELSAGERRRYLDIINNKLDHLNELVEHTLVLSRIDSGQAAFRFEDFSPGELTGSVLQRCEPLAETRGVAVDLDLEPGLPDVHADPLQISRVIQNLLENGIKFTPTGGRVHVTVRRDGAQVRFNVADTGAGIPAADLPHVFERFFTGDKSRTARPVEGEPGRLQRSVGLGLAIASRIVAEHDGSLEVDSTEGEGSVFWFNLRQAAHIVD